MLVVWLPGVDLYDVGSPVHVPLPVGLAPAPDKR
jgi:hypothetical protein